MTSTNTRQTVEVYGDITAFVRGATRHLPAIVARSTGDLPYTTRSLDRYIVQAVGLVLKEATSPAYRAAQGFAREAGFTTGRENASDLLSNATDDDNNDLLRFSVQSVLLSMVSLQMQRGAFILEDDLQTMLRPLPLWVPFHTRVTDAAIIKASRVARKITGELADVVDISAGLHNSIVEMHNVEATSPL
jgi:hypothetical protein